MSYTKFTLKDKDNKEHQYEVGYFLSREGLKIWGELGALVKKYAPIKEDMGSVGVINLAADVLSMCNDDTIKFLIEKMLVTSKRDGQSLTAETFDIFYAGNYEELVELVQKILEINYGGLVKNFFTKIQGKLKTLPNLQNLAK